MTAHFMPRAHSCNLQIVLLGVLLHHTSSAAKVWDFVQIVRFFKLLDVARMDLS